MELELFRLEDAGSFDLAPGASARPIFGHGAMINVVELEPNSVFPLHSHPEEQIGLVLRGQQVLIVDGVEHPLGPMDAYVIPPGLEHAARFGPEGATVIDVFQPVREDYLRRFGETSREGGTS